jgi:Xaa-Pro aminopeptidase
MKERGSYLSAAEQERRYSAFQGFMASADCVAAIVVGPAQVGGKRYFRYFTDWNIQSFGGYLFVTDAGRATSVLRAWSQAYWSNRIGWVTDIVSDRDPLGVVLDRIGELDGGRRIGIVGIDYMPVSDYTRLTAAIGGRLTDITEHVDGLMAVKSSEERALLRASGAIFDQAWDAVLREARPDMREWELAAIAGRELLASGVSHSIILVGAGGPDEPVACVGWPRDRRIGADEAVQMSIEGPGPSGYCVEVGGTFTFGAAPPGIRRQYEAQLQGMAAGVRLLIEGSTSGQVAAAVDGEFRAAGYHTGYPGMHGIGLGIPDPPPIEMGNPRKLVAGNVVAMHPNAVDDQGQGTLISRTYVVGHDEAECLSRWSLDLVEL